MRELGNAMNWIILTTITPCIMTLCAALFLLQAVKIVKMLIFEFIKIVLYCITSPIKMFNTQFQEDGVVTFSVIQMPILVTTSLLEILFAYSFFGQILHTKLADLNDAIYQSKWYQYPPCAQRIVLIMTLHVQKPFYIGAYGLLHCKLANFVDVSVRLK